MSPFLPSLLLPTILFLLSTLSSQQSICRGLAIEGGPNKGAYQAGALAGLISSLPPEETAYDVVSGISMGAVNAAWLAQFPKGQEQQMVDQLVDFWLGLKPSDIYKPWPGGMVQGALFESALYNTEAGQEYLKAHITQAPSRYISVGATNVNTGMYKSFNNFNETVQADQLLDMVMASAAVPTLFPPKFINDTAYFDGSVIKSLDIASIVRQCRQLNGNNDSNIVVDVILASEKLLNPPKLDKFDSLQVLVRQSEIIAFETGCIGLIRAQQFFPDIQFRYIVRPSEWFNIPRLPLDFKHKDISRLIEIGKKDAANVVKQGEGASFYEFIREVQKKTGEGSGMPSGEKFMKKYLNEVDEVLKSSGMKLLEKIRQVAE